MHVLVIQRCCGLKKIIRIFLLLNLINKLRRKERAEYLLNTQKKKKKFQIYISCIDKLHILLKFILRLYIKVKKMRPSWRRGGCGFDPEWEE